MHQFPVLHALSFVSVKWSQHCAFGTQRRFGVVYRVDQQREPKNVGKKNKFLFTNESTSKIHQKR
jgi:hypothetical protein